MHFRISILGIALGTGLIAACAQLPIPITVRGQDKMALEQSYPGSPDQLALCLMQELNEIWPIADHQPEILVPGQQYRITSSLKSLLRPVRDPDLVFEITSAGDFGTRATITTANNGEGAHRHLDRGVLASDRCLQRLGGSNAPIPSPPPSRPQWPGYSAPDQ
ncbi:hypothetical protein JCM17960_27200 [Magnetospira thiophila]